jgi:hypothetical protein
MQESIFHFDYTEFTEVTTLPPPFDYWNEKLVLFAHSYYRGYEIKLEK